VRIVKLETKEGLLRLRNGFRVRVIEGKEFERLFFDGGGTVL
jgi:hypothetical protein